MGIFPGDKPQYFPCPDCDESVASSASACASCGKRIDERLRAELVSKQVQAEAKLAPIFIVAGALSLVVGMTLIFLPQIARNLGEEPLDLWYLAPVFFVGGVVSIGLGLKGLLKKT